MNEMSKSNSIPESRGNINKETSLSLYQKDVKDDQLS